MKQAVAPLGRVPAEQAITWAGLSHLLVVYVVWSSTYLAMRVAVREGGGFTAFTLGATRFLLAGGLLLLWGIFARSRLRLAKGELALVAVSGVLVVVGGNGFILWAVQFADSGLAALVVGSSPIWVALIESVLDRRAPSRLFVLSLLVGFLGLGLLTAPVLLKGARADTLAVVALVLSAINWGAGMLLQRRKPVNLAPFVSSGYQQVFGGLGFALAALWFQGPVPNPSPEAWWAWGYLVVIGSLVAFTSFVQAVRLLPSSIVVTFAYVNPAGALLLGWLILNEPVTPWMVAGTAAVLLGVAGVFRDRGLQR